MMDLHQNYIEDYCRLCGGIVHSDRRRCEVSLFEAECKALWNLDVTKDSAEVHPVWVCHKCKKTLSGCRASLKSGKMFETAKKRWEWLPHSNLNCACLKGLPAPG